MIAKHLVLSHCQKTIKAIFGDVDMATELNKAMVGTPLEDIAMVGPRYSGVGKVNEFAMLYVGAENTTTHMHFDLQSFTFLWVASGRKRVRILPNDQRTARNVSMVNELYYSVWPEPGGRTDFLHQDPLPPHAVDVVLGPGEGMYIPYHTWHAVENLEPTVAFGLIRDFPHSESRKFCFRDGY